MDTVLLEKTQAVQTKIRNRTGEATRVVTYRQLASFLVNRFNGFKGLFEEQGDKVGFKWAYIYFRKPMKMRKNHRTEKVDGKKKRNPHIDNVFELNYMKIDLNSIYENAIATMQAKTGAEQNGYEGQGYRNNGIENWNGSRVVCHKQMENAIRFYLNYYKAEYPCDTVYEDKDGNILDYADLAEYHSKASKESKQKQADKQNLTLEAYVCPKQMMFENIIMVSIFGEKMELRAETIDDNEADAIDGIEMLEEITK